MHSDKRPNIPKRLASRIRAAQSKVSAERERIRHAERRQAQDRAEIAEYERDPAGYARRRYGPMHGVDSYPCTTRLQRLRDAVDQSVARRALRAHDLDEAERRLRQIEDEIAGEVANMRPSPGRIPWPKPLSRFVPPSTFKINAARIDEGRQMKEAEASALRDQTEQLGLEDTRARIRLEKELAFRPHRSSPSTSARSARVPLLGGLSIGVVSPHADAPLRLSRAVMADQEGAIIGRTWDLATQIMLAGADWTGWQEWHQEIRFAYQEALSDRPELRDCVFETEEERRGALQKRHDLIAALGRRHYLPETAFLPGLIEGPAVEPSKLRSHIEAWKFDDETAREWFLRSSFGLRVHRREDSGISSRTLAAMEIAGLVARGHDIPFIDVLGALGLKELKAILNRLGMRPDASRSRCLDLIVSASQEREEDIRQALAHGGHADLVSLRPPPDLDWHDFQCWRQQLRGMAVALTDLALGQVTSRRSRALLSS